MSFILYSLKYLKSFFSFLCVKEIPLDDVIRKSIM